MKMYLWLLLSLICEAAADYCFKRWSIGGRPWLFWLGVSGHVGATVLFAACLRGGGDPYWRGLWRAANRARFSTK